MPTAVFRNIAVTAVAAIILSGLANSGSLAQPAGDAIKHFGNSIVTAAPSEQSKLTTTPLPESVRKNATLQLHFGLATNNIEELQARVAKGERISPREMAAKYSGDPQSAKKLVDWLTQ
jgi:hypothetical protein